ncbi:formate dehydrogenase subunit gamma [Aestuariibius sp. 2305UL40-4]|uniref:formate dehydrogenase subunit gamma n=1 Tax=Aestuariibius violaceus TaxID=3234132 RepID=UPI00345E1383
MNVRLFAFLFAILLGSAASAQDAPEEAAPADRSATGGAQTLEDILRRQEGLPVEDRSGAPAGEAPVSSDQLGTLGGASDSDLWRELRYDTADVTSQIRGPATTTLIQDSGMAWTQFREGPLATYGGYLLLGTIVALFLFYMIRGKIRVYGKKSGQRVTRFKAFERFSHWLLAGSFILLGITGLITLFGRMTIGLFANNPAAYDTAREIYAFIALYSKWVHNNVSWAFMLALIFVFVLWVWHNLPDRTDFKWIAQGGGIIGNAHPPAKKFNFGQKMIFWSVIVLGGSISASGLSLLFPFELPMFAATFDKINAVGVPGWFGFAPLPTDLAPHQEMQLAQAWHAIVSFVLMAIIIAHIYIGSVGMEGAYDAMGSGEVSVEWAEQHHSIWAEKELTMPRKAPASAGATPAE